MFIKVKSFNGHAVSKNSIQTLNDMYRQEQGQTMENVSHVLSPKVKIRSK